MKQNIIKTLNRIWLTIALAFFNTLAFAESKSMDVNIDVNKGGSTTWYANPWAWIVGAAVFILLLVAIVRGGGRTSD